MIYLSTWVLIGMNMVVIILKCDRVRYQSIYTASWAYISRKNSFSIILLNMVFFNYTNSASLKEAQMVSRRELEEHLISGQPPAVARMNSVSTFTDPEIALDKLENMVLEVMPDW